MKSELYILSKTKIFKSNKKTVFYGCGWIYVVQKQDINKIFLFKNYLKIIFNFIFYFFTLRFVKSTYSLSTLLGRFYGLKKIEKGIIICTSEYITSKDYGGLAIFLKSF